MPAIFSRGPIPRIPAGPIGGPERPPQPHRPAPPAPQPPGIRRFLLESRAKVWANARLLDAARRAGPQAYADRLADLERLAAARVADLMAPGQVVLTLAVKGFGVRLPGA